MGPELTEFIGQLYLSAQMLVIAAARSLGFAVFFTPFVWSHMNSGLLRIAFGVALALPVMHPIWGEAPQMVQKLPAPVVIIVAKEIFIGMLLGLAASLPFEAIGAAGSFVDSQRNASTPIPSPAGELTPIGQIFMVAGLWLFATLGGFWMIVDAIFQSYRVWPPLALMPPLTMDGAMAIPALLSRLIMTAIVFSAPAMPAIRVPAGWPRLAVLKLICDPPARCTSSTTNVTVPATISTPIPLTTALRNCTKDPLFER
jgi:type III secretion protein T